MGFEMHEIKKNEIKVKVKVKEGDKYKEKEEYSDLWKEIIGMYINCFDKGKDVNNESIIKSRSEYLLADNPINGKTNQQMMSHWLYFTDNDKKVSFAIIQDSGNKYCYIDYIGTSAKGGGYGKKMLDTLCKKYKEIELSAVPGVYGFYKKCGFHPENLITKPLKPTNQKIKIMTEKKLNKIMPHMFKINQTTKDDSDFNKNHVKLDNIEESKKSKDDTEKPNRKK